MLKNELFVPTDVHELGQKLNKYITRFLSPSIFHEDNINQKIKSGDITTEIVEYIHLSQKNQIELRSRLIPKLHEEEHIIDSIITLLNKVDEDFLFSVERSRTLELLTGMQKIINDFYISRDITSNNLQNYQEKLYNLLVYLTALQSSIVTRERVYDKIKTKSECQILFTNTNSGSFTLQQQIKIIEYINFVLIKLFDSYSELFYTEIDTGSPEMNVAIDAKINIDVNLDVNGIVKSIFEHIDKDDKAKIIRNVKKINEIIEKQETEAIRSLKKLKKEILQDEYATRLLEIHDQYAELKRSNISAVVANIAELNRLTSVQTLKIEQK